MSDSRNFPEKHTLYTGLSFGKQKQDVKSSNVQIYKESSLKRHASTEDNTLDFAKKQRTERIITQRGLALEEGELDSLEEMMQKRARDESFTSDDGASPESKARRPLKRSKASSCHDILNSLSSSINFHSGIKRKNSKFIIFHHLKYVLLLV